MKLLDVLIVEANEFLIETATKRGFALREKGDSTEPELREGDIIVVNPHRKQEHNDYVILCNVEYEDRLKQPKKYGQARVLHPLKQDPITRKFHRIELSCSGLTLV